MSHDTPRRRVAPTASTGFEKTHRKGPPPETWWLPLTYDRAAGGGAK